ncbi:MAG: AAA family ATPase [Candidatus Sericytochromatia bacterium]|nr:AAA family ATPase [Candidatus Sericytochromatia bacterium]
MRILHATLRNYRGHRELALAFDPARTLIGGPNEAGKSTLVEAIHHALFLRYKVSGEMHRAMQPRQGGGHPEVELMFERGGRRYTLHKRFAGGAQSQASLRQENGATWHNDEAESQLAGLLGVQEAGRAGKGVREQWAHLWVRQGDSQDDPLDATRAQHPTLLARLQAQAGAVVGQSWRDERVVAGLSSELADYKTPGTGRPRAHGPLDLALQARAQAEASLNERKARLGALQQAVTGLEQARGALQEVAEAEQTLAPQLAELTRREAALQPLQAQEQSLLTQAQQRQDRLAVLQAVETEIQGLRDAYTTTLQALAPREQAIAEKHAALDAATSGYREAQAELAEGQTRLSAARATAALAEAAQRRLERWEAWQALVQQQEALAARQAERLTQAQALHRLPAIGSAELERLTRLERLRDQAAAGLAAMAAGVEVLAAPAGVTLGGEALQAGDARVVSEPTELSLPDGTRLRIQPGGGDALRQAREAAVRSDGELQAALADLTVGSREAAVQVAEARQQLERALAALDAELKASQADSLPERLAAAQAAHETALGEWERRVALQGEAIALPETLAAAQRWTREAAEASAQAEGAWRAAEQLKTTREAARERLRQDVSDAEQGLREEQQELQRLKALLTDRLGQHGDDALRQQALNDAQRARDEVEQALAQLRAELAALAPETLRQDTERLQRASRLQAERRRAAEEAAIQHEHTLRSDGSLDPAAEVDLAEAELARATAQLARLEQRVRALECLQAHFRDQRHQLVTRYTAPLTARIERYARCVFGPELQLVLESDATRGAIGSIKLNRGLSFAFAELSDGAKEQLAVAVRLAIAEVLAEAQGEGLPVVLDDAFTNADPVRVARLQGMLDLAAAQGLQVIVLTCTPRDYAALGAASVSLPPPSFASSHDA